MNIKIISIIVAIVVIIVAGTVVAVITHSNNKNDIFTVEPVTLTQELVVSGKVTPMSTTNLSFEQAGKIRSVSVTEGSEVSAGHVLAQLDDTELRTQLVKSNATLASNIAQQQQLVAARDTAQANLEELQLGAREEEVDLARTKVTNAEKSLSSARTDLANTQSKAAVDLDNLYGDVDDLINTAFINADNAINQKIDALFDDDTSSDPRLTFSTSDSLLKNSVEQERVTAGSAVNSLRTLAQNIPVTQAAKDSAINQTVTHLRVIRDFLNSLTTATNQSIGLSQTTLDSYHADINTARSNVTSELTNITTQQQLIASQRATNAQAVSTKETAVTTAENALSVAQAELSLLVAGATQEQIAAQKARVTQSEQAISAQDAIIAQTRAEIDTLNTQLDKLTLTAPIDGTITTVNIEPGEVVTTQTIIMTLISATQLHIESDIPEVSIAAVRVGLPVTITLDAYGDGVEFSAHVTAVDPAETIVDNVSTYTTTFDFDQPDARVRSGMTATISMVTDELVNVLALPQFVLQQNESKQYYVDIQIDAKGASARRVITPGFRSTDGYVEITSGLNEGDQIIIPKSSE